jgi:hypothetical protein
MCSPGCFSLFRGSALMDDHVLRTYCTKSVEARHYVQYDQGCFSSLLLFSLIAKFLFGFKVKIVGCVHFYYKKVIVLNIVLLRMH